MSPALLPRWGWIAVALVLWLIGNLADEESCFLRFVFFAGMVISALLGIVRFVKWAWGA